MPQIIHKAFIIYGANTIWLSYNPQGKCDDTCCRHCTGPHIGGVTVESTEANMVMPWHIIHKCFCHDLSSFEQKQFQITTDMIYNLLNITDAVFKVGEYIQFIIFCSCYWINII